MSLQVGYGFILGYKAPVQFRFQRSLVLGCFRQCVLLLALFGTMGDSNRSQLLGVRNGGMQGVSSGEQRKEQGGGWTEKAVVGISSLASLLITQPKNILDRGNCKSQHRYTLTHKPTEDTNPDMSAYQPHCPC